MPQNKTALFRQLIAADQAYEAALSARQAAREEYLAAKARLKQAEKECVRAMHDRERITAECVRVAEALPLRRRSACATALTRENPAL